MKTSGSNSSILARFALTTILPVISSAAFAGPGDLGGGNGQVGEFFDMARSFTRVMKAEGKLIEINFPTADLQNRIKTLKVEAVPGPLQLNNLKVDALNHPSENRVELDDQIWAKRSLRNRYRIVVHELLGLLRLSDEFYDHSGRLAEATVDAYLQRSSPSHAPIKNRSEELCVFDYFGMTSGLIGVMPEEFVHAASLFNSSSTPTSPGWNYTCEQDRFRIFVTVTMTRNRASNTKCVSPEDFKSAEHFASHFTNGQVGFEVAKATTEKACPQGQFATQFKVVDLNPPKMK